MPRYQSKGAWSRTIGLPLGPQPGSTEPVGFADALASAFELLLVGGLLAAGSDIPGRLGRQPARWGAIVVLGTVVVFVATMAALVALAPRSVPMG